MSVKRKKRIVLADKKRAAVSVFILLAVILAIVFFCFRSCGASDPIRKKIEADEGQRVTIIKTGIVASTPSGSTVEPSEKISFKIVCQYQNKSKNLKSAELTEGLLVEPAGTNATKYSDFVIEILPTAAVGETVKITASSEANGIEPVEFTYTVAAPDPTAEQ